MSDFINTIDALGDDVVMDSIIDRSITEFKDDKLTNIGDYAFYGCTALETVDLPNVTKLGVYVIANCSMLTKLSLPCLTETATNSMRENDRVEIIDLPVCTKIGVYSFANCIKLTALILRSETLCTLAGTTAFYNAAGGKEWIAAGTGYIYVPSALVEDYKAATNWSTYADQFRALEDYTVDGTTTGELDESKI